MCFIFYYIRLRFIHLIKMITYICIYITVLCTCGNLIIYVIRIVWNSMDFFCVPQKDQVNDLLFCCARIDHFWSLWEHISLEFLRLFSYFWSCNKYVLLNYPLQNFKILLPHSPTNHQRLNVCVWHSIINKPIVWVEENKQQLLWNKYYRHARLA